MVVEYAKTIVEPIVLAVISPEVSLTSPRVVNVSPQLAEGDLNPGQVSQRS